MIKDILVRELHNVADMIEKGTCELSEEDALEMFNVIANVSISKEEASVMLNMPTSTFDKKVKKGIISPSHKRKGITERLWFRKDVLIK